MVNYLIKLLSGSLIFTISLLKIKFFLMKSKDKFCTDNNFLY